MSARTVLLIDQDEDSRIVYSAMLQHHGFVVLEARDGQEGLRLACKVNPEVVVVDLHASVLDGCTLISLLKSQKQTSRIRSIVITTDVSPHSHRNARETGCDRILMKPLRPTELLEIVRSVTYPEISVA